MIRAILPAPLAFVSSQYIYIAAWISPGTVTNTLTVLAIIAGALMTLALVLARQDRERTAMWLFMLAFFVATIWSILNSIWARSNPSPLSPEIWLTMASMAAAAIVYYYYLWIDDMGAGAR